MILLERPLVVLSVCQNLNSCGRFLVFYLPHHCILFLPFLNLLVVPFFLNQLSFPTIRSFLSDGHTHRLLLLKKVFTLSLTPLPPFLLSPCCLKPGFALAGIKAQHVTLYRGGADAQPMMAFWFQREETPTTPQ